ncbi:hypothetical protein K0M31_013704, partial [Melipona bicolor]
MTSIFVGKIQRESTEHYRKAKNAWKQSALRHSGEKRRGKRKEVGRSGNNRGLAGPCTVGLRGLKIPKTMAITSEGRK